MLLRHSTHAQDLLLNSAGAVLQTVWGTIRCSRRVPKHASFACLDVDVEELDVVELVMVLVLVEEVVLLDVLVVVVMLVDVLVMLVEVEVVVLEVTDVELVVEEAVVLVVVDVLLVEELVPLVVVVALEDPVVVEVELLTSQRCAVCGVRLAAT